MVWIIKPLEVRSEFKVLGVPIDDKLKSFHQISEKVQKANQIMGLLTLSVPILQNSQTHSNNSSAIYRRIVLVCLTILWDWHLKG